jgi:hypothetical protein
MTAVRLQAAADILVFLFSILASILSDTLPAFYLKGSWGCYPEVNVFEVLKSALFIVTILSSTLGSVWKEAVVAYFVVLP